MKILWCSVTPYAPTGYGNQTALNVQQLTKLGHQVKILALGVKPDQPDTLWFGDQGKAADIIPAQQTKQDILNYYRNLLPVVTAWEPDLIIFLGDAWLTDIRPFREVMAFRPAPMLAVMSPVDCDPWSPRDRPLTHMADFAICMSHHAVKVMEHPRKYHIPHIVDTRWFDIRPRQSDTDKFVVGMVQANVGARKLVDIQLQAVALAREKIPNLVLYMHMDTWNHGGQGIDYAPLINELQLSDIAVTKSPLADPLVPVELAQLYNNFDVLLHATAGEGFGVPIAEAHACGVQAIVSHNSASKEHPGAMTVPCMHKFWVPQLESFHTAPLAVDIARALEIKNWQGLSLDGRRNLRRETEHRFSPAVVRDIHWKPFLERAGERVGR